MKHKEREKEKGENQLAKTRNENQITMSIHVPDNPNTPNQYSAIQCAQITTQSPKNQVLSLTPI